MATSKISMNFIVENVNFGSATVATSGGWDYEKSLTKSGYKAVGIVGIQKSGSGQGACPLARFSVDANAQTGQISIFNSSGSARTIGVTADILYVKA